MDRHSAVRVGHGLAWAKTILIGEHSVVYGYPAVALPLHDLQMRATATPTEGPSRLTSLGYDGPFKQAGPQFACVARAFEVARKRSGCLDQSFHIRTQSDFPHERGLGSSAASAGSIIRAVMDSCGLEPTREELLAMIHQAELIAHERPSGLDAAATTAPSPIRFQSGQMKLLSQRIRGSQLVIADSGVHGSTREAVSGLRTRYEADPDRYGSYINRLGELTQTSIEALAHGTIDVLGTVMNEAHDVLRLCGVSLDLLDSLTQAARQAGALGAKMTGGGLGGCLISLTDSDEATARVRRALIKAGAARTWTYQLRVSEGEM
ncbi:mevalonate kinase [Schaalia vaccimaxillae]|uniref:mevalonate kinase n=1 Tax=Schaalia vaccimaxillae TaxID=183916 RepID=UPI0003B64DA4|nr:mevalonate kinase [Schaalia vaccimaxillae]